MKSEHPINERNRTDIMPDASTQASAGRPTDRHKDEAIHAAARELLFQKGPGAVTIEAVARKAGVSKVTVYARHRNRDELIAFVIRAQSESFSANLPLPLSSFREVQSSLHNFCRSVTTFLTSQEHLQFLRVLSASMNMPEPMLQDIYNQGAAGTLQQVAHWLAALHDARLINCTQPERSAELLVGMLLRMDVMRNLFGLPVNHDEAELEAHVTFVTEMFLRGHRV